VLEADGRQIATARELGLQSIPPVSKWDIERVGKDIIDIPFTCDDTITRGIFPRAHDATGSNEPIYCRVTGIRPQYISKRGKAWRSSAI